MKQSFRVAIKITGHNTSHYVIRDRVDLKVIFRLIEYDIEEFEIESIKFVPIPALEEVSHD